MCRENISCDLIRKNVYFWLWENSYLLSINVKYELIFFNALKSVSMKLPNSAQMQRADMMNKITANLHKLLLTQYSFVIV